MAAISIPLLFSIQDKDGIDRSLSLLAKTIIPWLIFATASRCFQAAFIYTFYVRADEEGICLSVPLYHTLGIFLPFTKILKRNIRWGDFKVEGLEVKAEGHFAEERLLLLVIKKQNYKMKTFPFVESAEDIYSLLKHVQENHGKNIAIQKSYVGSDMNGNLDYFWKWYKIISVSIGGILVFLLINGHNSIAIVIFAVLFVLCALFPYLLAIITEINWSSSAVSRLMRLVTFCSGSLSGVLSYNTGSLSPTLLSTLISFSLVFNLGMPVICARYLNRSVVIWSGLALFTAGISNCVLSIQEKVV